MRPPPTCAPSIYAHALACARTPGTLFPAQRPHPCPPPALVPTVYARAQRPRLRTCAQCLRVRRAPTFAPNVRSTCVPTAYACTLHVHSTSQARSQHPHSPSMPSLAHLRPASTCGPAPPLRAQRSVYARAYRLRVHPASMCAPSALLCAQRPVYARAIHARAQRLRAYSVSYSGSSFAPNVRAQPLRSPQCLCSRTCAQHSPSRPMTALALSLYARAQRPAPPA